MLDQFRLSQLKRAFCPPRISWLLLAAIVVSMSTQAATPLTQAAPKVRVYKEILTLQSYNWRSALIPTQPDDPIYPYPRLDFDKVRGPSPITTTVVVLESPGARVTVAPEYGGRILRWFDKRNNRDVLYVNPVIKPTGWGYRGWWLATGGIEWAFPTNEHGLNEWRPWRYQTYTGSGYGAVVVADHEDRTGLDISVSIILYANDNIAVIPRITNRTRTPQHFQFWINAMLPYAPDAQFDLPARQVEVHSTGDASLPESGQKMNWPVFNGRDFSRASEWRQYLGVFAAPAVSGRAAVRYPSIGARITRTFPVGLARGVKLFLLGDLSPDLYTDGDSRYLELWGGYTRTFNDDATLQPGRSVMWSETWSTR